MPDTKASPSVIAAAIVAILGGALLLLISSLALFGMLLSPLPEGNPALPPAFQTAALVMMAILLAASLFGIATGIGLLFSRNWARVSVLVWGGLCAFFGAFGIPMVLLLPKLSPPTPQLPESSFRLMQTVLFFVYGLPLVVGIWWLVLFNRKSIKAQFIGLSELAALALPQKPRCPAPIAVLAWVYITAILNLVLLPLLPQNMPVFLFGLALPTKAGLALFLLGAIVCFAGGVGLLKLKPWSYSLVIGLHVFWLASSAVSMLTPGYEAAMVSYMKSSHAWQRLPNTQSSIDFVEQFWNWFMMLGLVLSVAILGLLLYYRRRFLEASSAARTSSENGLNKAGLRV